jgi:hypothetical protein
MEDKKVVEPAPVTKAPPIITDRAAIDARIATWFDENFRQPPITEAPGAWNLVMKARQDLASIIKGI